LNKLIWKLTGSIRARVELEVKSHLKQNEAIRTERDPLMARGFRRALEGRTFLGFLWIYALVDTLCVLSQYFCSRYLPANYFAWLPILDSEIVPKDLPTYLAAIQAALIAIVAVPVGLITYIGQRDDSTREIELYYRQSLAHEVFSSSLALLVVLTVQLLWPAQLLLHHFVPHPVFELDLSVAHVAWLVLNLGIAAKFITISLRYVDPRQRQKIRRSHIVNCILPTHLRAHLKLFYYSNTALEFLPQQRRGGFDNPVILFGRSARLEGSKEECVKTFKSPTVLGDLHLRVLGLALRPWLTRSIESSAPRRPGAARFAPFIGFLPDLDHPVRGRSAWCVSQRCVPLRWHERQLIGLAFHLRRVGNADRTPISAADLLDDLVAHAIAAIDRAANSAYERAIEEALDFHGFLLDVYATIDVRGEAFSFAQVPGYIEAPQQEWIRPYFRLSQKAVSKISEDTSYAAAVAYLPFKLLLARRQTPARAVVTELLNFSTYYVHRLEQWLTEHRRQRSEDDEKPAGTADLAGSEVRAYTAVIRQFVGIWRDTLRMSDTLMRWQVERDAGPETWWRQFAQSWWYSETHLFNSAYLLGVAVRNNDRRAAIAYLDTLIKWPSYLPIHDRHDALFFPAAMLSPEVIELSWEEAQTTAQAASPWPNQRYGATELATELLFIAHDDVTLLAGAVLISWCLHNRANVPLTVNSARNIFNRHSDFQESGHTAGEVFNPPDFQHLLLQILRITSSQSHPSSDQYGVRLDGLVHRLDSLREPDVVPGEIYSPGTIFGQHGLRAAFLCILLARISDLDRRHSKSPRQPFAIDLTQVPNGQARSFSLGAALQQLQQELNHSETVTRLIAGVQALNPDQDFDDGVTRLKQVLTEAIASLEASRAHWLREAPLAPGRLGEIEGAIRQHVQDNFQTNCILAAAPVFSDEPSNRNDIQARYITGQIKGQLVELPIEPKQTSFDRMIAEQVGMLLAQSIWGGFFQQPRRRVDTGVSITSLSFWAQVVRHARTVGPGAFVLMSMADVTSVYQERLSSGARSHKALVFERRDPDGSKAHKGYRFSVNDVDVYAVDIQPRTVFIASELQLTSFELGPVPGAAVPFTATFIPQGEPHGEALRIEWAARTTWADTAIFELQARAAKAE